MKDGNVVWYSHPVNKEQRAKRLDQSPEILWFTGLSGSGKSTLAGAVEERLFEMGHHVYLLDGDNVRHGLCGDLGFSDEARVENIRRIGETAKLFVDAGTIVSAAFISPFRADRRLVRDLVRPSEFVEVFIDTPLTVCEDRDPKGLYKKARNGEIKNFTGIDSPYEEPELAELVINTHEKDFKACL
ncbi:MAG: adenylyl-sulfate kinase [Cycloclasticus sp. symbiont of Poecilosclerida sp. M]|nr:MAG: adenylyl-sulfate kinase [Cycloclasticus sp. symbiont of Poecilosclerida sp. M]